MNQAALKKITMARTKLLFTNFFFGRLAMNLKLVEDSSIPTEATDGVKLLYNPSFILSISDDQLRAEVAHEVMHCVFDHSGQRGARDPRIWNIAADFVINIILHDANFKLGADWLLDMKYCGMGTVEVYNLLMQNADKQKQKFKFEPSDVMPPPSGQSPVEAKQTAAEWKALAAQAAIEATRQGTLPGSLERFLGELITPKVPWRDVLNRFLMNTVAADYTWTRPSRRFLARGMYMPRVEQENSGYIAVAIDTSGSIDGPTFTKFMSEIQGIAAQVRPSKIVVISADSEINHVDEFHRGEPIDVKMHGGGGTDFRPALKYLADDPPAAFVYLTDLYGPTGDDPGYPVLWCCTTKNVAPWGETIRLED